MIASARRRDVQGLRGVAVLLVVGQHVIGVPAGGFVGVDVFFVISGYVITRSLLVEWRTTGRIDLVSFLTNRARRLLPSAVLVLACTSAGAVFLFSEPRAGSIWLDALAGATSAANWHFLRAGTGYFGSDAPSPLLHFWSLSVEEQFYVVFPVLLIGCLVLARRTHRHRLVVLVAAAAVAVSMTIAAFESAARPEAAYFTTESRAWEFGVGALSALLAQRLAGLGTTSRRVLGTTGAAGIALSAIGSDGGAFPFPGALLPVFAAAAILAAGEGAGDTWSTLVLRRAPLVVVGDFSYVIYLWHLPILTFGDAFLPGRGAVKVATVLVVTGVVAWLTHHFVEEPLRRRRAPRKHAVQRCVSAAIVAVVVAGCGAQVIAVPGAQDRPRPPAVSAPLLDVDPFDSRTQLSRDIGESLALRHWPDTDPGIETVSAADAEAARLSGCLHDPRSVDLGELRDSLGECSWGPATGPVLTVFGDSIALGWTAGVIERYVPEGWRVVAVGLQSCAPSAVAVPDRTGRPDFVGECRTARTVAVDFITGLGSAAIMTSSSVGAFDRQHATTDSARIAAWRAGLAVTLRTFVAAGADVYVLGAPPEGADPSVCASRVSKPSDCVTQLGHSRRKMAVSEAAAVRDVGGPARYVPTDGWFCDRDGRCPLIVDSTVVRADRGHITTTFSARLARVLPSVSERD